MNNNDQFSALLIMPEDYIRHSNQVAFLNRHEITVIKRKRLSKAGCELVKIPMQECVGIVHKDEYSLFTLISGGLIIALILFIFTMVGIYWNELPNETKVPVGALVIGGGYGVTRLLGSKRHRLIFLMRDDSKWLFKSRAGEYKAASYGVDKTVAFARNNGLLK